MTLIKRITTPLVNSAIQRLDVTIEQERIRKFLHAKLLIVYNDLANHGDGNPPAYLPEYELAYTLSQKIGIDLPPIETGSFQKLTAELQKNIKDWVENLRKGRMVGIKGLIAGSGEVLWVLIEQDHGYAQLVEDNFERLLRHVEVKRKNALQLNPPVEQAATWLEKQAVSIAFSRYSRKNNDLRFLNAALKLNDWAFPTQSKLPLSSQLVRYLLALAEAEYTLESLSP